MAYLNIKNKFIAFVFFITLFPKIQAQQIPDSLLLKSYEELRDGVLKYLVQDKDTITAILFSNANYHKAKKENDTLEIVRGYYYRAISDRNNGTRLLYYDTIIDLSKNLEGKNYPTLAYNDKGAIYKNKLKFDIALDNYLNALEYNHGSLRKHINFLLNYQIAELKIRIDKDGEALELLKTCWAYILKKKYKNEIGEEREYYEEGLYSLANTYRKLNRLDSAAIYIKLGLNDEKIDKESIGFGRFLLLDGVLETLKKNNKKAEIQLLKSIDLFERNDVDKNTLSASYFFLGENHRQLKNDKKAVFYFKKVDSLFIVTGDIIPEYTGGYPFIADYFRNTNDLEQELMYTTRSLEIDSILREKYIKLNEDITNKFDFPKLKKDVERITAQVAYEKKIAKTYYLVLSGLIVLILAIAIYQYRKRRLYKKRFLNLVQKSEQVDENYDHKEVVLNNATLDVPEETIQEILSRLEIFEKKLQFIDPNLNLNKLAMTFGTNSSYLSKVINHYKNESFSSYIKKLRINYGFTKMKEDSIFRKYTIKAIAIECGFKTAESFSKTFYTTYGIYPSYFIKQIKKSIY